MKPYRLKHIPTGLYLDVRSRTLKLNEIGKIYNSGVNSLNWDSYYDWVVVDTKNGYQRCKKIDFEKVGVKIEDIPYED